eukprot:GHRQ01008830.1.p1 GENE.GHRQ01008830.1~~GHRQ01008830.1.p1  ORF type:complete len:246 (+),score=127.10 GHRQ01008830.1:546-1283(+)
MPKRATIIFTSNDGPRQEGPGLFVYYCKYSGKHAFTTDVDIDTLPLRRTDNARILDKTKHVVKLYTSDAGTKLLRRKDGSVERQHRLSVGSLPVAYTSDGSSDILYIMDRAVTSYNRDAGAGDRVPVPPCIRVGESGNVEVTLEIEDREKHVTIGKITADAVRVHITGNAKHESAQQEILALMAKTLTLRLTNLTLLRGSGSHNRVLVVEMLNTRQVYARLRGLPPPQRQDKPGFRKPKPWHHGL